METRPYLIDHFLSGDEAFHIARKSLSPESQGDAHTHDYFELFLVEEGTLRHWVNGHVAQLEPGHIVFIRPEDRHAVCATSTGPTKVMNVMFRPETAEHLVNRYVSDFDNRYFWTKDPMPASFLLTGERLHQAIGAFGALHRAPRMLSRVEEFLLTMMTRIIDAPETASATLPSWLITACQQARRPEVFRDGAAGFVRAAGRGHEHVCRKTKEYLGVTPSALINKIRMEHAAQLLAAEDLSVSEVADDCGIENMSHFYRVFRQHYGVTPKVFRKQHQRSPF